MRWLALTILVPAAISAQSHLSVRLSGGISRAFEATGVVAGIGVLPWTIADGKAVRFRAGVDGWLSYAEVTSKPGAHRTMWGVGPMVELSIPAAGTPTSIYTRAAIHIASSSISGGLTTDQESVPYPYRVGTTMSGITFGGEAGLAFRDGSGVARFRLGVGYLRHLIYPEHSGGITRLVLSVDL